MLRRCKEDSHASRDGRHRHFGQSIIIDCIHVDRRLIADLDLELPVVAGRENIGGADPGIEAGNHLRSVGDVKDWVLGRVLPSRPMLET